MKRLLIILLVPLMLFAAGKKISPLPLPHITFLNLDIYPCDRDCLQDHLAHGEIFSFLAKLQPQYLPSFKEELAALPFAKPAISKDHIEIVLIAPSTKLAPLLSKSAKIIGYYLLQNNQPFTLTTTIDANLQASIDAASDSDLIILFLPFSQRNMLTSLYSRTKLFIPTINKRFLQEPHDFYYGGIDYFAQIDALLEQNSNPLTIFYSPNIELLTLLTQYTTEKAQNSSLIKVKNRGNNLKWQIKERRSLSYNDILLNTPIVTSSLVLSQLTLYKQTPPHKFATQITLSPKIFEYTQDRDRQNLIVANSILSLPPQTEAALELAKSDLFYDWIGYSCIVAINNLFLDRTVHEQFVEHQLEFDIALWRYKAMGFERISQENSLGF